MRSDIVLLSLASLSAANVLQQRQDTTEAPAPTGLNISPECLSKLAAIASEAPTLPPQLASAYSSITDIAAACTFTPPASLKSDFSAYTKSALSYASKNSALIKSCLPTDNPIFSSYASLGGNICSNTGAITQPTATAGGGGSSPTASNTSGGSSTTSSSSGSSASAKPNSAARDTGVGMAALAGVLMVAAFL